MSIILDPHTLLTPYRFDIMIKYLYGKSILRDYNTSVFRKFYYAHIEVWNCFNEPGNESKNSFKAFDETFRTLLKDISINGFDSSKGCIPIYKNSILNGAHRLTASLLLDKPVECVNGEPYIDGVFNASWLDRFSKHSLDSKMTDLAAIQYTKLKQTTHIAILFPSAYEHFDQCVKMLNTQFDGAIVYSKYVNFTDNGRFNLMNEFYGCESWIGNESDDFAGLRWKTKKCFSASKEALVLLLDYDNLDELVKAKQTIRDICGVGNHSMHSTDFHDQAIELSRLFFNDNSLDVLNIMKKHQYDYFDRLLRLFKFEFNVDTTLAIDEYCITASSVLSVIGLRQGDDLDYIHTTNAPKLHSHGYTINSHNEYGEKTKIYPDVYDELIMNPENHFYYKGVKFLSIKNLIKIKINRGEPKDLVDLKLLSTLLLDNC